MKSSNPRSVAFPLGVAVGVLLGVVLLVASIQAGLLQIPSSNTGGLTQDKPAGDGVQAMDRATSLPPAARAEQLPQGRAAISSEVVPEFHELIEILPATVPTAAQLEKRYAKFTLPELMGAEKSLAFIAHHESTAFLEQKMERGHFTTQILPLGAPFSPPDEAPGSGPRTTMTKWHTQADGSAEVWLAEISPDEQPLLEARYVELDWLRAKVHGLTKDE